MTKDKLNQLTIPKHNLYENINKQNEAQTNPTCCKCLPQRRRV